MSGLTIELLCIDQIIIGGQIGHKKSTADRRAF